MGIVRMGPPEQLLESIAAQFKVDVFVETGTYRGDTATWASQRFSKVITLENFKPAFDEAVARHGHISNVEFLYGHSACVLPRVLQKLEGDAIFWLDAHWMGEGSYGEADECPVLSEIRFLNQSRHVHFIFIDDARLFLSPPPLPHRIEQWPTIAEIVEELSRKDRYTIVDEDVIISVPVAAKNLVGRLVQERTTLHWRTQEAADQPRGDMAFPLKTILKRLFK